MSENQRKRIEEINLELDSIEAEKTKRQLKGRPIHDLEKRQEELEQQNKNLSGKSLTSGAHELFPFPMDSSNPETVGLSLSSVLGTNIQTYGSVTKYSV